MLCVVIGNSYVAQAMEHRYTVLAEEQGRLAATNNRIESERQQLAKVLLAIH